MITAPETTTITLAGARRLFAAQLGPRIMFVYVSVALAARLAVGGWSGRDLLAAAVLLGLEPFTEWAIHVFMLHFRPRAVFGRTIDIDVARKHRAHHADPNDLELVFVPLRMLVTGVPVVWVLFLLLAPLQVATTLILASTLMLSLYEWTHFLIHQPYRPKTRYYRSIWRAHRLHHYRNEHYWFGVTINVGDHVLGTFPEKTAVPVSPTARTLLDRAPTVRSDPPQPRLSKWTTRQNEPRRRRNRSSCGCSQPTSMAEFMGGTATNVSGPSPKAW